MFFIMPFIFAQQGNNFIELKYLIIGNLVALIPIYFFIDKESIGRKLIISISFIALLISFLLMYALKHHMIKIGY